MSVNRLPAFLTLLMIFFFWHELLNSSIQSMLVEVPVICELTFIASVELCKKMNDMVSA